MARLRSSLIPVFLVAISALVLVAAAETSKPAQPAWAMNATIIEACSCPMFCQCYFNGEPATHAGEGMHKGHAHGTYCRFNNAYQINHGNYGTTSLDGAKFWIAGDLGANFGMGKTDWAVLTFDPSVTQAQRDGIAVVLGKVYPVQWGSFAIGKDAPMTWQATKDMASATLDGGKAAEVQLARFQGMSDDPVVIKNLRYFGAARNSGFIMMPNKVETYHLGDKPFEFHGTNGFMITIDTKSTDVPATAGAM